MATQEATARGAALAGTPFAAWSVVWTVDVAIIGGGPAGSTCARQLVAAGLDVVVIDEARFPRDKVCAGWITPDVVRLLDIDLADYGARHVLQPYTGFRVGLLGHAATLVEYGRVVSYGIRRVEFDDYLLTRAGARVVDGRRVAHIAREGARWVIDGEWSARYLVGAGGHRCPVARVLNPTVGRERVVVAQRTEATLAVPGLGSSTPELYFAEDLQGYGWIVPKGTWVNIGLGRTDRQHLSTHVRDFLYGLGARGRLTAEAERGWSGHAYLLASQSARRVVGDHAVLAGDAAGVAAPGSGEGIRGAVVSGSWAADAIGRLALAGDHTALATYAAALGGRLGVGRAARPMTSWLPASWRTAAVGAAFRSRAFVRHAVLDRAFLHALVPDAGPAMAVAAHPRR